MIYLDNAATSFPKPDAVIRAIEQTLREGGGNAGRGVHGKASAATQGIRETRARLAGLFGIGDPDRLAFTFNATDALNIAIKGFVRPGDHVVTSQIEHNSVLRPLLGLETAGLISVTRVGVSPDGFIDPGDVGRALGDRTRLVVVTHASNVLGTVQPVAAIADVCRRRGVALLVDAAQSAGEIGIDVDAMGIDMLAFPGHKSLLGPQGTGGLYVRDGIELRPWREGGTGTESAVEAQPADYPTRLEAGTQNLPGIMGLGAGVRYVTETGVERLHAGCMALVGRILDAFAQDDRIVVYGSTDLKRHVHALSFNIRGIDPSEVGMILDQSFGVAVRTGLHCAAPIHRMIGTYPAGTVRVSPGPFNTDADIETFLGAVKEIAGG